MTRDKSDLTAKNGLNEAKSTSGSASRSHNFGSSKDSQDSSLIKPHETLIKVEDGAIVIRNVDGKLVRRRFSGELTDELKVLKPNEQFIREDGESVVLKNTDGKLIKRKKKAVSKSNIANDNTAIKSRPVIVEEPKKQEKKDLWDTISKRHAFLARIENGEKVSAPKEKIVVEAVPQSDSDPNLVEEIEEIEETEVDSSVTDIERAVESETFRKSIGKGSSKGVHQNARTSAVTSGAINPNLKKNVDTKKMGQSLAGNNISPEIVIATPVQAKPKKEKKQRKPIKTWVLVVALVSVYVIGALLYFFFNYNFKPKTVDVVLYDINVGEDAKQEYYDGEKFNFNEMYMTYYYSEDKAEVSPIGESNFAEVTPGMGYSLNKGYISALWVDSFKTASSRVVKVKFNCDSLICYVPVTIYRNQLIQLEEYFDITNLQAGVTLSPTIFGVYSNRVLEASHETIKRELSSSEYTLILNYDHQSYDLKELGFEKNGEYTFPEKIQTESGEIVIDYSSNVTLVAETYDDGYNATKQLQIY